MRKTLIAATALVLLGAYQVPALAAAPGAPTDVQISWVDVAQKTVKITWKDNGEKNYFDYEIDGAEAGTLPGSEGAGGDNTVVLTVGSRLIDKAKVRYVVWSEDAAGAVSAKTATAWFDTQLARAPSLTNAEVLPDLSLRLSHRLPADRDITPGDPLDLPAGASFAVGRWTKNVTQPTETFQVAAGSTTTTIPPRPRPYEVDFQSRNEWGSRTNYLPLLFATMGAALKVNALSTFGDSTGFRIDSGPLMCLVPGPSCTYTNAPGSVTQLQSRANAGQPWKTIGTYYGLGTFVHGSVPANGSTQYRVYMPAWKDLAPTGRMGITAPTSTSARNASTQAAVDFGLTKSNALVGQVVQAVVSVKPAGGGKASLQWLDGKVWRTSAYIPLTKGKGTLSFKASGRGTTRYWRVAIPQLTWYGKVIVPTTSYPFALTVR